VDHLTQSQEKEFDSAFGKVTCKIPSLKQRLDVSKRMQRYSESLNLSINDWDLIEVMALLDVVVSAAPKEFIKDKSTNGWDYDKLFDLEALISLGQEVRKWLDSFRKPVRGEQDPVGV